MMEVGGKRSTRVRIALCHEPISLVSSQLVKPDQAQTFVARFHRPAQPPPPDIKEVPLEVAQDGNMILDYMLLQDVPYALPRDCQNRVYILQVLRKYELPASRSNA